VLMREAVALGLDQGDRVIRQRLAQKLEMTLAEIAALEVPGEAELRAFHAARLDTYTAPQRVSFTHRFVDAKRHGDDLPQAAQSLARALGAGDPFHAPLTLTEAVPEQLARVFGPGFRDAVLQLAEQAGAGAGWSSPLASPWGLHLVRIDAYAPARLEEFDEVRERVLADWRRDAVERAQASRIDAMRARYTVEIAPTDFLFEP
jgi:peptidyl-prolyl cis-trans isomerase C